MHIKYLVSVIYIFKLAVILFLFVDQKGDIVKDPMKSIPFVPKTIPGVGWGGSCRGGVGYGGSYRGGVCHAGVGWGGSCRGGVGWVM